MTQEAKTLDERTDELLELLTAKESKKAGLAVKVAAGVVLGLAAFAVVAFLRKRHAE